MRHLIEGGAGTVTNSGTIVGGPGNSGVQLRNGGSVHNQDGGTITGFNSGVYVNGGPAAVTNAGSIGSTSAIGYGVSLPGGPCR